MDRRNHFDRSVHRYKEEEQVEVVCEEAVTSGSAFQGVALSEHSSAKLVNIL